MSELPHTPPAEAALGSQVVELHHRSIDLPQGRYLHDLEATRSEGINGATVAEIELPTPVAPGHSIDKRLAVIDMGEDMPPEGRAVLFYPDLRLEQKNLGMTRSRYLLVGVNYSHESSLASVLELKAGTSHVIGRKNQDGVNHDNFLLGLSESGSKLSDEHATISVGENGKVTVEDHSDNGIKVTLPGQEKAGKASKKAGARIFGRLATRLSRST